MNLKVIASLAAASACLVGAGAGYVVAKQTITVSCPANTPHAVQQDNALKKFLAAPMLPTTGGKTY